MFSDLFSYFVIPTMVSISAFGVYYILNPVKGNDIIKDVAWQSVNLYSKASIYFENLANSIEDDNEDENDDFNSLDNAPVLISSKKAFGNIEIGRVNTNENGRAEYIIPESLIGDEEGFVSIVISLTKEYEAEEVALDKARVGKPKVVPKLIKNEVLWSTNDNVSLWLLLSYLLFAGGAWAIIGYVIYQIVKIKKYSKLS